MEPRAKKPAKREESVPLEAIRILLQQHTITLQPIVNQVSELPIDKQLEYYFVPIQFMDIYRLYYQPVKPYKNLKLVNFDKPAISLSFTSKHKYTIERSVPHSEVVLHLKNYRDELLNKLLMQQLSPNQLPRTIREQLDAYQA